MPPPFLSSVSIVLSVNLAAILEFVSPARMDDRFARLEQDVIRDHGERISRLEARPE